MVTLSLKSTKNDNTIVWAVVLSVALHILVVYVIPGIDFDKLETKVSMTVDLASPEPTQADPVVMPQPQPQPITPPQPLKKLEQALKPDTRPSLPQTPSQMTEPSSNSNEQEDTKAQPVIVSKSDSSEEPKAAAALPAQVEQPKPVAPTQQDISDARNQYGNLLTQHIGKFKQYPRIAQMRSWEGDVVLQLELDSNGNLTSSQIYKSSGVEILDKQALEMVKKAAPFPSAPAALHGRSFSILVPVTFRLE